MKKNKLVWLIPLSIALAGVLLVAGIMYKKTSDALGDANAQIEQLNGTVATLEEQLNNAPKTQDLNKLTQTNADYANTIQEKENKIVELQGVIAEQETEITSYKEQLIAIQTEIEEKAAAQNIDFETIAKEVEESELYTDATFEERAKMFIKVLVAATDKVTDKDITADKKKKTLNIENDFVKGTVVLGDTIDVNVVFVDEDTTTTEVKSSSTDKAEKKVSTETETETSLEDEDTTEDETKSEEKSTKSLDSRTR